MTFNAVRSKAKGYLADFTFCEACPNNLYGTSEVRIKEQPQGKYSFYVLNQNENLSCIRSRAVEFRV